MFAVHGGNANLRAYGSLRHRNRDHAVQVVALAREEGMLFDVQHYVQISGRPAESANFPSAGKANSSAVFHTGGNFGVHGALAQNAPFALALRARIGDDAACALAGGTATGNAEESLLIPNLAASVAGAPSRGALSRRRSGAAAVFASFVTADRNLSICSEEGLLELQS